MSIGWFLCLVTFQSIAQPYSISGSIKDSESGEPLSYATIKIKDTSQGTVSNVDGFFTLLNVRSIDSVALVCNYIGYKTQQFTLLLTNDVKIQIELESSTAQLDEVVITAKEFQLMKASEGLSQTRLSSIEIL